MTELWDKIGRFPITNYFNLFRNLSEIQCKNSSETANFDEIGQARGRLVGDLEKDCDAILRLKIFFYRSAT